MRRLNVRIRAVGGVVVLALAMGGTVGCGSKAATGDSGQAGTGGIGGVTPSPSGTAGRGASSAPSTGPSAVLPDGRSAAYLTALSTTKNTVTFDLIDFLTGDAAKKEWVKEHPDQPDGPDNDYMIINNNKMLRTLPVAVSAQCTCLGDVLGSADTTSVRFSALPALLKQQNDGGTGPDLVPLPFWLTVKNGTVTGFEEQFVP